jgi:hypothetical protein
MANGQQCGNREAKKIVSTKAVQATPEESMNFRNLVSCGRPTVNSSCERILDTTS